MITVQEITELGAQEAVARHTNHQGWAVASNAAFHVLFGAGASLGAYQEMTTDETIVRIGTTTCNYPPDVW